MKVPKGLMRVALWGAVLELLFLGVSPLLAQTDVEAIFSRKETYGIGPRAMGMGCAFVAVADDASAAYWNVAGLAQISSYEISASSAPAYFSNDRPYWKNGNMDQNAFDFPWYASLQFVIPVAKENTLAISLFRPFHPQMDLFLGNPASATDKAEASYILNPTFQENQLVLSYAARFSSVRNFSVGVNVKRVTNDPYYIAYFGSPLITGLGGEVKVNGYGVDIGLLYRIPLTKYSEEFRVGLALNDLVARASYPSGLRTGYFGGTLTIRHQHGEGTELPIPPLITLGFAYKNDYLFKVRNITAFDIAQIADARFKDAENKILRFGTEFWFLRDVLALRGGYSTPLSRPGTVHLGLSVRALGGNFQGDIAYLHPVAELAVLDGNIASGINYEKFHIGATYRFGGGDELPPPKVSAFVRPASFIPSRGEKAVFHLDTTEDVAIDRWSVLIYDSNNKLARSLRGKGTPPTKVSWQGENDLYEPLPAGTYTWAFQVRDNLDHVGSTPVQTVEILGPPNVQEPSKDPARLLALRKQQEALLAQERQALTKLAQESLAKLLGTIEATPTTATALATPLEAAGNSLYPEAGAIPSLGFNNVAQDQVLSAHFDRNVDGDRQVVVSYKSNLTYVPYLYQEAAEVIKTAVNSVGTGLKEISTRVYYGKNEMTLLTSTQAAANFAAGRIDRQKLLELSDIRINGEKVGPNGY